MQKYKKRLLAALVVLLMIFTMASSAAAAETDLPAITRQPQQQTRSTTNRTLTLRVEAQPPEGAGPLQYQWRRVEGENDQILEGKTESTLTYPLTLDDIHLAPTKAKGISGSYYGFDNRLEFYAEVFCENAEGELVRVESERARVYVYVNFLDYFRALGKDWKELAGAKAENFTWVVGKAVILMFVVPILVLLLPYHYISFWTAKV
jgi:hypothetical protein